MHINKLELFGFKSFANKTVLTFSPGITVIVGPNGCGKTNIVDAIRWVLGEQRTTVLRSEIMENVIFNGSVNRKPLGMAEVSLNFANSGRVLPTEFEEVVISRRLFRDGESHYLLNNTQCRLKDIVNLFLDTGIGTNSYSVIELKMVEAILSGKPEERRFLIEEAAGINKYKLRRKEAVRKLTYVQNDLVRIQDLLSEVDKQVKSLARQSAKTKRYNKLHLELLGMEKEYIKYDFLNINTILSDSREKISALHLSKSQLTHSIQENEEYKNNLEFNFKSVNEQFAQAMHEEQEIESKIASLNQNLAVSIEKQHAFEHDIERTLNEIKQIVESVNEQNIALKLNIEKIAENKQQQAAIQERLAKAKEDLYLSSDAVTVTRKKLNEKNEEIINLRNRIESMQISNTKNENRKSLLAQKIEESDKEIIIIQEQIQTINKEIDQAVQNKDNLQNAHKQDSDKLQNFINQRNELNQLIDDQKHKLADIRIKIAGKNSEYELLSNITITDAATKHLLESKEWLAEIPKQLLIELIVTEDNYKPAIEAALGDFANVFIVDTRNQSLAAIELLRNKNLGKASFFSRDRIPNIKAPETLPTGNISGVIGSISELVEADDDIRSILRVIAKDYYLVNDLNSAEELIKAYPHITAITVSGEIADGSGFIRGGSKSKKEGLTVGKVQRVDKLKKELNALHKNLKAEESVLAEYQKKYLEFDVEKLRSQIKHHETELFYSEKNISKLQFQVESLQNTIANVRHNIDNFNKELAQLGTENSDSSVLIQTISAELELKKKDMISLNINLRNAEEEYTSKLNDVKDIELGLTRLLAELENEERENNRIKNYINSLETKKQNLITDIETSKNEILKLKNNIGNLDNELKELLKLSEEAKTKRQFLQESKNELEQQIEQIENQISKLRKDLEKLTEDIHTIDLKISENNLKLESVIERNLALDNEKVELTNITISEDFSPESTKIAIQELKNKLTSLGMINFMALEEYEAEFKRFEFLNKQIQDLTESEKAIQESIKEINETAQNLFLDTFNKIKDNFSKLFKTLFTEAGEAEIRLAGDNILECDIEIIAKPAGKKPHFIDMLSGGEKTLTSIAFLFAIYLVKPSPFCILDEVDAPLDDNNIDKFLNMIKDFSQNTQFLIVTHNKRTMEFADALYGITQQDEGISKIVSVRFNN